MLLTDTEHREEIFTHLESAFICPPHNIAGLADGLSILMNDVSLRRHLADQALTAVQEYFHQDPKMFQKQYRASIEQALFAGEVGDDTTENVA